MTERSDLHLPAGGRPVRGAAVVLHPHPAMGGDRSHPLVVAVAEGLAAAGIAALRPDLPDPDPARSGWALGAAAEQVLHDTATDRLVLVGYSWGSVVTSLVRMPQLAGRVLVAPPVAMVEMGGDDGTPALVLVPEHDQYGGPDAVSQRVETWPETTVEVVAGADHFLAGAVARVAARAVAWTVGQLG